MWQNWLLIWPPFWIWRQNAVRISIFFCRNLLALGRYWWEACFKIVFSYFQQAGSQNIMKKWKSWKSGSAILDMAAILNLELKLFWCELTQYWLLLMKRVKLDQSVTNNISHNWHCKNIGGHLGFWPPYCF